MSNMKKRKNFDLSDDVVTLLERLAALSGRTQTEILEGLIRDKLSDWMADGLEKKRQAILKIGKSK